jgi:hypothetical protein
MRHFALLTILSSFVFIVPVSGDDTTNPPAAVSVNALIEELGSKEFHARESATKRLGALGIEILPALQKAKFNSDPEVRRRLEELISPLERTVTLMPKKVTLHVKNKTIREVLAEFGKQTGYKLGTWPDPGMNGEKEKTVYTFDFEKLAFWEALDKLCESAGLVLQPNFGEESLRLFYQDSYVPFICYSGAFRVVATGFNYSRNNNFAQRPRNPSPSTPQDYESLQINLMVAAEPKLPLLRLGLVKITAAEDDAGRSMIPMASADPNEWGGMRHYYGGYYRGNYIQPTQANLVWPAKTSKTVKNLRGVIPVTLLADQKPAVVTDKILSAKGKQFNAAGATFQIEDVTAQAGNHQIKMLVNENSGATDYSQIQTLQQRIEVQDTNGNKLTSYFNNTTWPGPTSAQFSMTISPSPANVGPPAKLIYYTWVLMDHEIAFEFKDLPLP